MASSIVTTRALRAAIYHPTDIAARVEALKTMRRLAEDRGWTVESFAGDRVRDAFEFKTALGRLLRDVREGRVDVVVCWSLDALARGLRELGLIVGQLKLARAHLVSYSDGIDTTRRNAMAFYGHLEALRRFEAGVMGERSQRRLGER